MSSSEALSIEFSDSELVDIDASLCVVIGVVLFFCHVLYKPWSVGQQCPTNVGCHCFTMGKRATLQ